MTTRQTDPGGGIASRIREARRGAGLTQDQLAALVGVTAHTVWCWEAGRTRPTYEHRAAITFHCGMDVGELEGRPRHQRDLIEETAAALRRAVLHLPEEDIKFIWTFIRFKRWRRRRLGRPGSEAGASAPFRSNTFQTSPGARSAGANSTTCPSG